MTIQSALLAALLPALLAPRLQAQTIRYGQVDAMSQALNASSCLDCNYDGSARAAEVVAVPIAGDFKAGIKKIESSVKNGLSKTSKALKSRLKNPAEPPEPEYGPIKNPPQEKKPDVNRWNNAIEGANGAVYFGLIGMIFGGPAGMVLGAVIGFLMMYYGRQHNDR